MPERLFSEVIPGWEAIRAPARFIVITNKYTGGINGNQVWFYKVINGDHEWPPGWPKRSGNGDLDTSEEIWKFFVTDMKNRGVI